jgi:hypothetical protein
MKVGFANEAGASFWRRIVDLHENGKHLVSRKILGPAEIKEFVDQFLGGQIGQACKVELMELLVFEIEKFFGDGFFAEGPAGEVVEGARRRSANIRSTGVESGESRTKIGQTVSRGSWQLL